MRQTLGAPSIPKYHTSISIETRTFIHNILDGPSNYLAHIRRYAGGLTLSAVYGYQVSSSDDRFLVLADKCMDLLANRMTSGSGLWAVDIFPFIKYLPNWFPGASFKRYAIEWKPLMLDFVNKPYEHSQESFVSHRCWGGKRLNIPCSARAHFYPRFAPRHLRVRPSTLKRSTRI